MPFDLPAFADHIKHRALGRSLALSIRVSRREVQKCINAYLLLFLFSLSRTEGRNQLRLEDHTYTYIRYSATQVLS